MFLEFIRDLVDEEEVSFWVGCDLANVKVECICKMLLMIFFELWMTM
jgi:hypothetical protein